MIAETQVGIQNMAAGNRLPIRSDKSGAMVVARRTRYQEAVLQGNVFALTQSNATYYTPVVGNYLAAGVPVPATSTGFALWNPVGSGKNLVLWQYSFNITVSTTVNAAGTAACWHFLVNAAAVTASSGTTIRNLNGSSGGSVASCINSAAGTAMTGATNPYVLCMSNFSYQPNTLQLLVVPNYTTDFIDGLIIIPPGVGWIPVIGGLPTSTPTVSHSVIWEEVPV